MNATEGLDFVPRSQLAKRLRAGWKLIPGHDYQRGDWAILMMPPADKKRPTPEEVVGIIARLSSPTRPRMSNRAARNISLKGRRPKAAMEIAECTH